MLIQGRTTIAESSSIKTPITIPTKNPELTNMNKRFAKISSIWLQASKNPFIN